MAALRGKSSLELTDFGCGDGTFLKSLLMELRIPAQSLKLTLIEPDPDYLKSALERVREFSAEVPGAAAQLAQAAPSADVVMSNHVLNYVRDLASTLGELRSNLREKGTLLVTLPDSRHGIVRAWRHFFSMFGQEVPFHISEDLERELRRVGAEFRNLPLVSEVRFKGSRENRLMMLRFCMGSHMRRFASLDAPLAYFDVFAQGDEIVLPLTDNLIIATF
jgi:SAM-dependent methyltransferase